MSRRMLTGRLLYVRRRKLYKYKTAADFVCETGITGAPTRAFPWVELAADGRLFIRKGYAWDGASGPAIDTKNWMRPSLVHDALYQLMRSPDGVLDSGYRKRVDRLMYHMLIEEGMSRARASWSYWAVRAFGKGRAKPKRQKVYQVG